MTHLEHKIIQPMKKRTSKNGLHLHTQEKKPDIQQNYSKTQARTSIPHKQNNQRSFTFTTTKRM